MTKRALIYTRVSQDRANGRSPEEQEAECRAVCQREGWDVAGVLTDSVGASRHSKGKREGWDKAKHLIASGAVDVLVTWEASRAERKLAGVADLIDLCGNHGVLWNYKGRSYDPSSSSDRFTIGLDGLVAAREADDASDRVRRAMSSSAVRGRPPGRRLFGYQRTYDPDTGLMLGQVPHPDEAPTVQRIFSSYLAGKGIRTIARELNNEGITTGTGATWADGQVRRVLTNPAYIARRVHRGEVIGDAAWDALVPVETFDKVQVRLAARRGIRQTKTARLVTGVGRCGVCGGRLHVLHDVRKRKFYECRHGYCVARDAAKLEAYVTVVVLERLSQPDVAESLSAAPNPEAQQARATVAELKQRLDDAVAQFTSGKLSAVVLAKVEADLQPRIAEAEKAARSALVPIELDLPAPENVDAWWDELEGVQRREVVSALISSVTVQKTKMGTRTFDPETVEVEWRR